MPPPANSNPVRDFSVEKCHFSYLECLFVIGIGDYQWLPVSVSRVLRMWREAGYYRIISVLHSQLSSNRPTNYIWSGILEGFKYLATSLNLIHSTVHSKMFQMSIILTFQISLLYNKGCHSFLALSKKINLHVELYHNSETLSRTMQRIPWSVLASLHVVVSR